MSAKANYFKIGIFIISATVIAIIAIITLGVGTFFKKKIFFETYIEGSVQGLDVGSPVKLRGVPVGNVEEIAFVNEKYNLDPFSKEYLSSGQYVYIKIAVEPARETTEEERRAFIVNSIAKGLRLRLASQGITGGAYLEADFLDPERYPPMEITFWEPRFCYIPSAPSTITQFTESVDGILRKLEEINVKGITDGLEKTIGSVNRILDEVKLAKIAEQAGQMLTELSETNERLGPILSNVSAAMATIQRITKETEKPLTKSLNSLGELPEILAQVKLALRRFTNLLADEEQNIGVSAENVRLITGNLRDLSENARSFPSQVIFGGSPPRSLRGRKK